MEEEWEEGQEVKVFDRNGKFMRQPEGGWDGTIAAVGRTFVHIDYPGNTRSIPEPFHKKTQMNKGGHRFFKTPERVEADNRRASVLASLRSRGIVVQEVCAQAPIRVEKLEALLRVLEEGG